MRLRAGGSNPICRAKTRASHTTLAKRGNAIASLKVTIHSPGLGRKRRREGRYERSRYGALMPSPRLVNTMNPEIAGRVSVAARAELMNGAVQGVATAVASAPLRNDPIWFVGSFDDPAQLWSRAPTTTSVRKMNPITSKVNSITTTKVGD
jgi:hypothetical protein